jgi:hypothetical protein
MIVHALRILAEADAAPYATDAIYDAIRSTANMLLTESGDDGKWLLKRYDRATHDMAERFARFLSAGLDKGDARWP